MAEDGAPPRDLRVTAQPTVPVRAWRPGARYTYRYKSARTYGMKAQKRFELLLDGTLSLTVVGVEAEAIHLRAELRDAHLVGRGATAPAGVDDGRLRRPFFITVEPSGRIVSLRFERTLDGESRNQLKAVAASMQLTAPAQPELTEWLATEQDSAGEYVAAYSCAGTLPTIRRSKQRYVRVQSANGLVPVSDLGAYEVASRGAVVLEADGWPRSIDDDETVAVTVRAQGGEYVMDAKVSATLVGADEAPAAIGALTREAAGFEESTFDLRDQLKAAAAQMDVARAGGASLAAILGELHALSSDSREDQARAHALVARLGALFRIRPKQADDARAALMREPVGMTSRTLVGGLSAAGTAEAQQALIAVAHAGEAPAETRTAAVIGLGLSQHPTAPAMKATAQMIDSSHEEQHNAAALALGNQVRDARDGEPDAAGAALSALLARLEGATTTAETVLFLDALGNTGDARALPAIQKRLTSGDPAVRAAAYGALRFMSAPESEGLLVAGLTIDADPRVRIAVLGAMAQRRLEPFAEAILTAMRADPSKDVRSQALSIVVRHAGAIAGSAEAIAWAARNEKEPDLRAAAERAHAAD